MIRQIIYDDNFDLLAALEDHLRALEDQKTHVDALIALVTKSILTLKGETTMNDKEKFETFKEDIIRRHEEQYGAEVREKYGDEGIDEAHRKIRNMSESDYERFKDLSDEIRKCLEKAVRAGLSCDSEEARRIVTLHKDWLCMTWKEYTKAAHQAVASTYISDERFRLYYDRNVSGCAEFLEKAIRCYTAAVE